MILVSRPTTLPRHDGRLHRINVEIVLKVLQRHVILGLLPLEAVHMPRRRLGLVLVASVLVIVAGSAIRSRKFDTMTSLPLLLLLPLHTTAAVRAFAHGPGKAAADAGANRAVEGLQKLQGQPRACGGGSAATWGVAGTFLRLDHAVLSGQGR
eukprot:scaffold4937_cov261-Pinguiococcus_pyrenoidosus.AAC.3